MVKELIELNATEKFLAKQGVTITLKEVADEYNKKNSNLMRDFKKMIASLNDDELAALRFEGSSYIGEDSTVRPTFNLDLKTMLWFMTKFDHSLRLKVINYAFNKLEEEKQEAVKQAKLPKIYKDGNMSVRGCIATAWDDSEDAPMEKDIWNALVWKGFVVTRAKATIQRKIPDNLDGFIGSTKGDRGFATFKPHIVREVWEEFEKANKPVKSEYERLHDEFTQISEYYNKKLEEAKNK